MEVMVLSMHKDLASSFSPLTAGGEQAADTVAETRANATHILTT